MEHRSLKSDTYSRLERFIALGNVAPVLHRWKARSNLVVRDFLHHVEVTGRAKNSV